MSTIYYEHLKSKGSFLLTETKWDGSMRNLPTTADFEDGGKGHKECRWPLQAGRGKEVMLSYILPVIFLQEEIQPCWCIGFSQVRPMLEFWPQKSKIINLHWFKPLNYYNVIIIRMHVHVCIHACLLSIRIFIFIHIMCYTYSKVMPLHF